MNKSRIEKLIPIADQAIKSSGIVKDGKVNESYDGKIAGFGVSVAMSGLRPTLAMYFNESKSEKVKTRPILDAIAIIIVEDKEYSDLKAATAKAILEYALQINDSEEKKLKKYVLEAAIALKLVVRTYELEEQKEA